MKVSNNRGSTTLLALLGIIIAVLLAVLIIQNMQANKTQIKTAIELSDQYYAVLLTNGQAYFGKLEKLNSQYPVLRDIYYIQSQVNQQTNQPTNTLIKRGNEWHKPDRMILNRDHILFIEPVSKDSQMAKLIDEDKKKK